MSALRAKLDLDSWGEMNTIRGQVLIYLLLVMELGGLRVEIHADLCLKLGSLSLLFCYSLALARTATALDLPPFVISEEEEDRVMKTRGQEDHNDEEDERLDSGVWGQSLVFERDF